MAKRTDAAAAASKTGPEVVEYIGTSDVRIIGDVEWSAENAFTVVAADLPAETLEHCLEYPEEFRCGDPIIVADPLEAEEPALQEEAPAPVDATPEVIDESSAPADE